VRKLALILPVASGLLVAGPFLAPALFPLAWIGLVPLLWSIRDAGYRRSFLYGWLAGIVANLLGFYWLNYTISVFGGFSSYLSAVVFAGYGLSAGFFFALFALLARFCGFGPMGLFPPVFWVALEFWYPFLFPWHLANSQSQLLSLIQCADLVGPYGVSFLLVWISVIMVKWLSSTQASRTAAVKATAFALGIVCACLGYGYWRLRLVADEMRAAQTLSVAAIQGSIDIHKKWNMSFLESNLQSYLDLSRDTRGATLALWPESAVENWISEGMARLPNSHIPEFPPETQYLIFGARSFRGDPASPSVKAFNSAFLVDSRGRALGHYHKQVLLAFGEYIPFVRFLANVPGMPPIGQGFTPGPGPRTLNLPGAIRIGPLICYEDLMPFLARALVREGRANILVNLTNDAWFGNTVAPWQHARLAQWRAIETRRTLIRITNTGLTTIINARGEMLQTLPLFTTGILKADAQVLDSQTLYVRFGDWFAWLATLVSVFAYSLTRWSRRGARFEKLLT
jgi:apolipoprotein N-acyltransferase